MAQNSGTASGTASGTEGYAEQAAVLLRQYESITFADAHRVVLHLISPVPCTVVDIGAGTGRDAAALAAMGHRVVAVEPTAALRNGAMALHSSSLIEWLDDSLPDLARLRARGAVFDLVMLTAVWMHLDAVQRRRGMPNVASLMRARGMMTMTLRHGPVPMGRRMFEVSARETIQLAEAEGLRLVLEVEAPPALQQPGVTWTHLAFTKDR
ncbi:MAG TPA: class I SAM-dependent methyltransferase [Stellaceae bacterium]|nr:class I SAM-dependent methyltransferase [Stellaceae bacterium]